MSTKINKQTIVIFTIPMLLLTIPFIGNSLSEAVNWTAFDFLIAGILLFSAAFAVHLVLKKLTNNKLKPLIIVGILLILMMLWAELAVGIFGSPIAGS